MFEKILIANRGEIACRILRTARRLGIRTVAVYSDADTRARHVRLADEAWHIGASESSASYLAMDRILDACRKSGAQAVHPGYGFLSENADFAEACQSAGRVFIGPPPSAIRAMSSKSAARESMQQAGLPLTPGYHGDIQEADFLQAQAESIGYPVLLKPVAGGGGKGMRIVYEHEAKNGGFATMLAACRREARSAFGDDRVLVEKYLPHARHIEIQIFADAHGHAVHLFERDCSVQRRHQKVLEESPAPGMTAHRRAAMGEAALMAARTTGYVGAGTVEFIVEAQSPEGAFYFMEMNTRLQVEHPVTEMVTGLDLVEWQLRIAAGEALPMTQEEISLQGHAIEARLYAEDPSRDFLPAPGRLLHLALPEETPTLRIDRGVDAGDTIPSFYDPMVAKLVVHGRSRSEALMRLQSALSQCQLLGVANNLHFLSRLVACPAFQGAELDTRLIERERASLLPQVSGTIPDEAFLLAALAEIRPPSRSPDYPWHCPDGWRLQGHAPRHFYLHSAQLDHTPLPAGTGAAAKKPPARHLALSREGRYFHTRLDDRSFLALPEWHDEHRLAAEINGHRLQAIVIPVETRRHVWFDGHAHVLTCIDPLQGHDNEAGAEHRLSSPIPGKIVALLVRPGEHVPCGTPLLILEAMKMETTLRAPANGLVRRFPHAVGEQVEGDTELVDFLPDTPRTP